MNLSVGDGKVRIEANGIELLRLKASFVARLGTLLKTAAGHLVFPESSLSFVRDLIPRSAKGSENIFRILQKFDAHSTARETALKILEDQDSSSVPEAWREILDPAQSLAVAAMTLPDLLGLCLFDEQGSGKTVMTIAAFDVLKAKGLVDAMIVACPKSMLESWRNDIERFLPGKYSVEIADGNRQEKYRAAMKAYDVLITNYEALDLIRVSVSASSRKRPHLLIIDESFFLKNSEAFRSEAALRIRESCKKCFVLCGTPAPNSAYDLVNQFDLADSGFTFGAFSKTSDPVKDRLKISELVDTKGTFIRRLKADILGKVPDKNFHIVRLPLKGRQALMYDKARSSLEIELRSLDNTAFKKKLATYFQKRSALLQICCSPAALDPTTTEPSVKMEYLDNLVEKLIEAGRKVILWSFYAKSLDELSARYARYNPLRIDGSVSTIERGNAVKLFQGDPTRLLFIGNPAAAGAGITLHASFDAVYVSYSNQAAHYLQSLDRIHRRGQKSNEVNYYLLMCEGTIEETEVLRLRGKELSQHSLLGDHVPWPTSLDDALNELSHPKV